jgi:anti-sigma28 factor (negative regulator of flagellin synthesis)
MRTHTQIQNEMTSKLKDVSRIARPESVVMLAATVRAARELLRTVRIEGLKERVSEGGYVVSSKDLAQRVLSTKV